MKNLFRKHAAVGISAAEFEALRAKPCDEHAETGAAHKKPTEYMRGLQFAIDALCEFEPHEL